MGYGKSPLTIHRRLRLYSYPNLLFNAGLLDCPHPKQCPPAGMAYDSAKPNAPSTEDAMASALQAEHEAMEAIEHCRREATMLLEEARGQARTIAERTDARISALHNRCSRSVAEQVETLFQEDAAQSEQTTPLAVTAAALRAAVEELAVELTDTTQPPREEAKEDSTP